MSSLPGSWHSTGPPARRASLRLGCQPGNPPGDICSERPPKYRSTHGKHGDEKRVEATFPISRRNKERYDSHHSDHDGHRGCVHNTEWKESCARLRVERG